MLLYLIARVSFWNQRNIYVLKHHFNILPLPALGYPVEDKVLLIWPFEVYTDKKGSGLSDF